MRWLHICYGFYFPMYGFDAIASDLVVTYLTNARLATVTRRERLCELGGLEYLLNPCARLDTPLHPGLDPGLDPGVGFSLECECSVTRVAAQSGLV